LLFFLTGCILAGKQEIQTEIREIQIKIRENQTKKQ
jgi:hypothetical protein